MKIIIRCKPFRVESVFKQVSVDKTNFYAPKTVLVADDNQKCARTYVTELKTSSTVRR